MELIASNRAIFSPRGFLPRVRDASTEVEVVAGSVWGTDGLARLRTAALVRIVPTPPREASSGLGRLLGPDDLALRTVLWLALAGVPVSSTGLARGVLDRLDPALRSLLDRVRPAAVVDPEARELLSLELRRCARTLLTLPTHRATPALAVLLPQDTLRTQTLVEELDAQTWPAIVHLPAADDERSAELVAQAAAEGVLYCTRMRGDVRYGPHHLADLVAALRYSGARVAHSPLRFRPWHDGSWLEDDALGVEGSAAAGLPGGSVWYAADGPDTPEGEGYAVHGCNAVPSDFRPGASPVALRRHDRLPAVLDWLSVGNRHGSPPGGPEAGSARTSADGAGAPCSYFEIGPSDRARSSVTASES